MFKTFIVALVAAVASAAIADLKYVPVPTTADAVLKI